MFDYKEKQGKEKQVGDDKHAVITLNLPKQPAKCLERQATEGSLA
jgi:hypothetical protein